MIIIKPRLLYLVAWIIVGIFFFSVGVMALINAADKKPLALMFLIFGMIGSFYGVHAILNRSKFVLTVSTDGIKINHGNLVKFIYADEISEIRYISNFAGRRITITTINGNIIRFDPSKWCSQKLFLQYCKQCGLPCA